MNTSIRRFLIVALLLAGIAACTTVNKPDLGNMSFADEPLTGKIIWHDLITEDFDAAKNFYSGMFGWTFTDAQRNSGSEYAVARSGDIYVGGIVAFAAPDDDANYSRWLPYISVPNVDEAASRGTTAGAEVAVSPRNVDLGRVAAMIDPEGAVIGLVNSAFGDPDDRTTAAAPNRPVWTELLADDAEAAAKFYGTLAGYDIDTIERRGGQYTFLANDGINRAGVFQKPGTQYKPLWLTYFGVEDPAAAAALAESLGGTIILPVSEDLRDGTMAVVADPTGALLALQVWSFTGEEE
jgi:predicted enzyme related to lactoylglutathione lyase